MTSSRIVCLRFLALLAALICSLTTDAAPLYARGDVHIVLVVSTTDSDMQDAARIWKERIKGTLIFCGLGEEDVASYEVLEGDAVHPENILKVCREVSVKAGDNDAIAVFMMSHGGTVGDNDDDKKHVLLSAGTDASTGIERRAIMSALKVRKHRLIVLVTDSCSVSLLQLTSQELMAMEPASELYRAFALPFNIVIAMTKAMEPENERHGVHPKSDGYLKSFLTEAEGDVNINSTDYGEVAEFLGNVENSSAGNPLVGTRFSSAFVKFATNGYYLDDELNPDGFYDLLNVELTREVEKFNRLLREKGARCRQTPASFSDEGRRIRHDRLTNEECKKLDADRNREMRDSDEFEVDE